jgi:hypothetical protein
MTPYLGTFTLQAFTGAWPDKIFPLLENFLEINGNMDYHYIVVLSRTGSGSRAVEFCENSPPNFFQIKKPQRGSFILIIQ